MQNNSNIEQIKQRKAQRERLIRIRLLCVAGLFIVFIILLFTCITSISKYFKNKPLPPQPVNIMSYNPAATPVPQTTEDEIPKVIYTEPVSTPVAYSFDGIYDRLESVKTNKDKKICYLTFDDGPNNSITLQVLDVLRRYNIKATFFQVGTLIESNPDVARRVYEEGHLIANHSYSHNYNNLYSGAEGFMSEIHKTEALIKNLLNSETEYFPLIRFPGGSHNAGKYKEQKQHIKEVASQAGYIYCDWNSLNGDAEGKTKTADELFEYFKSTTKTSQPAVVLMHDTVTKQATVDSLPKIIEYMMENGYTFLRLDQNI